MGKRVWTDDAVADLTKRWMAGESYGIVADALSTTRGAVSGKVKRLNLNRASTAPIVQIPYPQRTSKPMTLAKPSSKPPEPPEVRLGPPVPLMDLKPSMCRYPLGETESPDFGFCGNATEPGRSYCWACELIVFQPQSPRKQRAA
jgi:GcrA cell cycle regulator